MTKEEFEKLSEALKLDICKEIAYEYAAFVSKDERSAILKFKSYVDLNGKKFLEKNLLKAAEGEPIFPYDVIMEKTDKMIENYYQEFKLGINAQDLLANYGSRGEKFNTYFINCLKDSEKTSKARIKQELFKQLCSTSDAKTAMQGVGNVIEQRTSSFNELLKSLFKQMEQLTLLWDYQDKGYTKYRINATGESCKECQSIHGKILNIADSAIGENLSPLHPNCDCTIEILDEQENVVYSSANTEEAQDWEKYIQASLKQLILGNYTDDVNLLGTILQVLAGLVGVDLPLDFRDLFYDITNFEATKEHIVQTVLDLAAVLPVVGGIKYADEAGTLLKSGAKYGDEAADIIKNSINEELSSNILKKKIYSLPKNPDNLLNNGWKETTPPQMSSKTPSRTFTDKDTRLKIRFDKGTKNAGGYGAKDHYHIINPKSTGKHDYYLDKYGNPVPKNSKKSHIIP